jgi:hypothetical protein
MADDEEPQAKRAKDDGDVQPLAKGWEKRMSRRDGQIYISLETYLI